MSTIELKLQFVIFPFLIGQFCEKILLFVRDWGRKVTTQRWGAILGNGSKKVGKRCLIWNDCSSNRPWL